MRPDPSFSGGMPIQPRGIPGADRSLWFQPPNLTPLPGSALMRFPDRDTLVARFQKGGRKYQATPMPWNCFDKLTAEDAGALYAALQGRFPFRVARPFSGPRSTRG